MNWKQSYIYFVFLLVIILITSVIWVKIDTRPPSWDESIHLDLSLDYLNFIQARPSNWPTRILDNSFYYPPLYHLLIVPFHSLLNISADNFIFVNIVFMFILLFSVWQVGKILYSDSVGLLSAVLLASYPFLQWTFHRPLIDFSVTAMVMLTYYLYLKSDNFSSRKYSLLLGMVAGAGMLIKWSYIFFIVIPMFVYFISLIRNKKGIGSLINFGILVVMALVISAPWYLRHSFQLVMKFISNMYGAINVEKDPYIFSIASFIYYIRAFRYQLSTIYMILFVVGLFMFIWGWRRSNIGLLLWLLPGYLIITFLSNKDYRFSLPLLPIIALISVHWLVNLKKEKDKKMINGIFVIISAIIFSVNNFFPANVPVFSGLVWSDPPARENWQQELCIKKIISSHDKDSDFVTVRFIANHAYFNCNNFNFYYRASDISVPKIYFADYEKNLTELSDFIIYKSESRGPEFTEKQYSPAVTSIREKENYFIQVFQPVLDIPLPDKSKVTIYKLKPKPWLPSSVNVLDLLELIKNHLTGYGILGRLSFTLNTISSPATKSGQFKSLIMKAPYAELQGLLVRDFSIELEEIMINLPALIENKKFLILKVRKIIPRFCILSSDLKKFIESKVPGLNLASLQMRNGRIIIDGYFRNVPLSAVITIQHMAVVKKIKISVDELRLGRYIKVPKFFYYAFASWEINLEPSRGWPVLTGINKVSIENDRLEVN